MAGGITRTHGYVNNPKNFAGVSLQDFTLTFWGGDQFKIAADATTSDGAIDRIFRTALGTVGTVSRVGTVTTGSGAGACYVRFALEVLGADADSTGYLGAGTSNATATTSTLEAAVTGLGTVNSIYLSSATIRTFTY
jgi:hypothetical protein